MLPTFCLKSRAENTLTQYRYAFNAFCRWCGAFIPSISALPAADEHVALYIISIAKDYKSSSKIQLAIHSISWAHQLAGLKDPCESALVKLTKEGAIRETSKPVVKKEPITPDHLKLLVQRYKSNNLYNMRTLCMCLLGFAGFLRFSELANIRLMDVSFNDVCMKINIVKSKTDVYKEGHELCIARTHGDTCPVHTLEEYISLLGVEVNSSDYLFRSLTFCKYANVYKVRRDNRPLSYTRASEIVLHAFGEIGLDKSKFGIHSLRSGGATAAAAAGINDRLFKKHGRWRSEKAKDGYVRESIQEKLFVTQNLGI